MGIHEVEILVYGAEERCASCVNLPSSKETTEWLTDVCRTLCGCF
jgi:disulfide oxidoreductase YuzD